MKNLCVGVGVGTGIGVGSGVTGGDAPFFQHR